MAKVTNFLDGRFLKGEILTDALREIVNNPFKESFYGKRGRKKKPINVLTVFSISYRNSVKTFLK